MNQKKSLKRKENDPRAQKTQNSHQPEIQKRSAYFLFKEIASNPSLELPKRKRKQTTK